MYDIEKTKAAKIFIDKMANGINPLDNSAVPDNDLLNNVHITRCLYFVSDILKQVIEDDSKSGKTFRIPFNLTEDDLKDFRFSEDPLTITYIASRFDELKKNPDMKKFTFKVITDYLVENEILYRGEQNGSMKTLPTPLGKELGITTELRHSSRGEYTAVLYPLETQHFIVNHFFDMIKLRDSKKQN